MAGRSDIFHESWYQIAGQRICLRSSVAVIRQMFRGRHWYVLHDPFSNQFFRIRAEAYRFIAKLGLSATVGEAWEAVLEENPAEAPGQGDVIDLLAQLHHANLIQYQKSPDSLKLFEKYRKRKGAQAKSTLMNLMFARIPLWDPHYLLERLQPLIDVLIGPLGLIAWIAMIGIGGKAAIDAYPALRSQSEGILSASNLPWLYLGMVLVKVIHEFGHAFAVRRFGGEVHALGIMLMLFTPLPYTDATAAWAFRSKWQRIFVGAAGMIFELFVAATAAIVFAHTGEGPVHAVAYNMIFTASVSTLIFNGNPLLRYDGYYMLADFMDMPNLQQKANAQITYLVESYAFGRRDAVPPAVAAGEARFLAAYAVLSFAYRIAVFSGILMLVSKKMLLLGLAMLVFFAVTWIAVPVYRFLFYLLKGPALARVRRRAIRVSLAAAVLLFAALDYVPVPYGFTAPGVLKAVDENQTVNRTAGRVVSLAVPSGRWVHKGDTLLVLENFELAKQREETEAKLRESRCALAKAVSKSQADIEPAQKRLEAFTRQLDRFDEQIRDLAVRAQIDGVWVSPDLDGFPSRWLPRGTPLGQILDPGSFYFASVIAQSDISELFARRPGDVRIRLAGQAGRKVAVAGFQVIPMERSRLPSMALGIYGGGDIVVKPGDSSGTRALEPFYEVRAEVAPSDSLPLFHGQRGRIRFALGYRPLLWQAWRKARQLVQKHYQV